MSDRFREIARKYTPAFIRVRFKRSRNGKVILAPAHACIERAEMLVPKPDTIEGLVYYLHESAHFWLRHFHPDETDNKVLRHLYTGGHVETVAQQEYEAEVWTIATLRREGIPVPSHMLDDMKRYVRDCLKVNDGVPPKRVKRFSKKRGVTRPSS